MNRITRRKASKLGSSKLKSNPFESRGLEKFQEVYSELERMRASIAAQEGVSTSDVWFTRGTSKSREWVPVVVGKSSSSSLSSQLRKQHSIPHWETDDEDLVSVSQKSSEREESQESRISNTSCSSSWFPIRSEQIIYDLQQFARKAWKAITVFIMVVAAVADVFVALVAGCASSFVAKHLRPLWADHLPQECNKALGLSSPLALTLVTPPASPTYSCMSAPSSPRCQLHQLQLQKHQQQGSLKASKLSRSSNQPTSFSTPVSPVRNSSTFFSPARPMELSKLSPTRQTVQQEEQPRSDPTPVIFTVLVILFSLTVGRVTAVFVASTTWFVFPVARKLVSGPSNRSV